MFTWCVMEIMKLIIKVPVNDELKYFHTTIGVRGQGSAGVRVRGQQSLTNKNGHFFSSNIYLNAAFIHVVIMT